MEAVMHWAMHWLSKNWNFWVVLGLSGQAVFASRFYVQWFASEKAKKSIVPRSFWYLSIVGSVILLAYAIYRKDIVFTLGQLPGTTIYFRNLRLLKKEGQNASSQSV